MVADRSRLKFGCYESTAFTPVPPLPFFDTSPPTATDPRGADFEPDSYVSSAAVQQHQLPSDSGRLFKKAFNYSTPIV